MKTIGFPYLGLSNAYFHLDLRPIDADGNSSKDILLNGGAKGWFTIVQGYV